MNFELLRFPPYASLGPFTCLSWVRSSLKVVKYVLKLHKLHQVSIYATQTIYATPDRKCDANVVRHGQFLRAQLVPRTELCPDLISCDTGQAESLLYLFSHFLDQAFPCRDIIREILINTYKRTANPTYYREVRRTRPMVLIHLLSSIPL